MRQTSRRTFLASTAALSTSVSDQPSDISDFEECVVTVEAVEIKPAGAETPATDESPEDADLVTVDADGATADLVQLQGDASAVVAEGELETGEYEWLRLQVSNVDATLAEDGSEADVTTPGDAPLKFNPSFEIRADTTTSFTADFTPVDQGGRGYVLQPVASETTVTYSDDATPSDSPTETTASETDA